jgi:hypothetical protein
MNADSHGFSLTSPASLFTVCMVWAGGLSPHTGPNPSPIPDSTEGTLALFRNYLPSGIIPSLTHQ